MTKKKAIKVIAATAIAASSFAAVAPNNADAASTSTSKLVKDASTKAKAAYDKYAKSTKYVKTGTMDAAIKTAKASYDKAKKALDKYKGKDKKTLQASLKKSADYIKKAEGYRAGAHNAYLAKKALLEEAAAVKALLEAKDVDLVKAEAALTTLNANIAKAEKAIKDTIVGATPEKYVKATYTTPVKAQVKELQAKLEELKAIPKLDSVTAATSKSLVVKFSKAVDSTKATFELKKDGYKVNYSSITFNADKTAATVELTSKITKGEYAVTVKGLTETDLTGSVKTEDEKVAKIEVLSNEVPLTDVAGGDVAANDLSVPYKVSNQYGEDITKTAAVITSSGVVDSANGVVNFEGTYDTTTNKTVAFTIINVESNVSTSAVVTAVASSTESAVEIKGIYNKDGKTLTETTDLTKDKFFLEIEVKDQYGKVIKSPRATSLLLSETNNTVVDAADTTQTPTLDTTTVDGKVLIPINAPVAGIKAGESNITLIAKNTGKSSQYNVKVAEGVRANTVTLGQPNLVAAGEDALIPVTVLDKEGNEIKDLNILTSPTRGLNVGVNTLIKKDDAIYLKVTTPAAGPNIAMLTVIPTQKIVTTNYTVREAAKPSVITGLDSTIQTSISNGLSQEIKGQDLIIEDQYGRVMTDAAVNTWLATAGNSIILTSSKETTDNSPFTVGATGSLTDAATKVITLSTEAFTIGAKTAAGLNATEKMTFALSTDGATPIASTSKDVVFTKVGITDFASYEVAAPSVVFNDTSAYDFKVYGVKSDGSKTLLEKSQYNVVLPTEFNLSGTNENVLALDAALAGTVIDNDGTTSAPVSKDFTIKVVIGNDAATTLTKVVKVSAEPRKDASFAVSSTGTSTGDALSTLVYEASTNTTTGTNDATIVDLADTAITTSTGTLNLATLENNLYYVDQYGKETIAPIGNVELTFSSLVDADDSVTKAAIANNGSSTAAITNLEAGDSVKVKVEVAGLEAKTLTVTIK